MGTSIQSFFKPDNQKGNLKTIDFGTSAVKFDVKPNLVDEVLMSEFGNTIQSFKSSKRSVKRHDADT